MSYSIDNRAAMFNGVRPVRSTCVPLGCVFFIKECKFIINVVLSEAEKKFLGAFPHGCCMEQRTFNTFQTAPCKHQYHFYKEEKPCATTGKVSI